MLAEFLKVLTILLSFAVKILYFLILIRVIFSWINPYSLGSARDLIYKITEPILRPLRVILHLGVGGLDLSPIIAFLILFLIERYLVSWLFALSNTL